MPLGGRDFTLFLARLLKERGCDFHDFVGLNLAKEIKEQHGVATEQTVSEVTYKMPDGKSITIGQERSLCIDAMFRPLEAAGWSLPPIQEFICETIEACRIDLRKELYRNIVLCGGNTCYKGMPERLKKEIASIA